MSEKDTIQTVSRSHAEGMYTYEKMRRYMIKLDAKLEKIRKKKERKKRSKLLKKLTKLGDRALEKRMTEFMNIPHIKEYKIKDNI